MPDEPADFEIPYLILADSAEAVGGKLYMLGGGWDRMMVPNLPGRSAKPFALAAGISVPYSHTNRKFILTLELIDADGNSVGDQLRAQLETGRPPGIKPGSSQSLPIAIATHPEFPAPGDYSFVARIDGEIKRQASFEVMPLQLPFAPPQPTG